MEKEKNTVTPEEAVQGLAEALDQGNVESVIVIWTEKDGEIKSAFSDQRTTHALGVLDLVKHSTLTDWVAEDKAEK